MNILKKGRENLLRKENYKMWMLRLVLKVDLLSILFLSLNK